MSTVPSQAFLPSSASQAAILEYFRQAYSLLNTNWSIRGQLEHVDRIYMREIDRTVEQHKAELANLKGDPTKFQNIVLPVVMPAVENAVTYQQSVFLSGYPIFPCAAPAGMEDAALMMDTLIGEQQIRGQWVSNIQKSIRNMFKYNLCATEVDWERKVTYDVSTDIATTGGRQGKPKQVIWEGNKVKNLDLYNTFWDTRVKPTEVSEYGEFAGYTELMSRIRFKQFVERLPTKINIKLAMETQAGNIAIGGGANSMQSYYIPLLNPRSIINAEALGMGMDWMRWVGAAGSQVNIRYGNVFQVSTIYARIMPSDFKFDRIPGANTPQVWKFILVNNQVVIYAERMTNAHDLLPIIFGQAYDDGLGYQTKSMTQNIEPIQAVGTALVNSDIAARRRAIADRLLYDPSRVSSAAIASDKAVARIPVRPGAYGNNVSEAVHQLPFEDGQFVQTSNSLNTLMGFGNSITGMNPARQGQFVKGNKSRYEYADVMANANGRDQATSIVIHDNFFTPMKEIIKSNILQYQGTTQVHNRELNVTTNIDPDLLRKANLSFKLADGLLPSDKIIDGTSLEAALQAMAQNPALSQAYNVGPMFSYLMKSRGANLTPYEKSPEQMAYEQAIQQWQLAVQQIITSIVSDKSRQLPPEEIQKALPPQPTPEQFGYDPKAGNSRYLNGTIANVVSQVTSPAGAEQ